MIENKGRWKLGGDLLQVDGTHREGDSDGFPEGKSLVFF